MASKRNEQAAHPAPHQLCPLGGFGVLEIGGADAAAFLQAQLINDVAALDDGLWHWSGYLTPKGRVIGLFALLQVAADAYLAVLPDLPAAELQQRLQRYVLRSKVRLSSEEHWSALGLLGDWHSFAADARGARAATRDDGGWLLDWGTPVSPRWVWLQRSERLALPGEGAHVEDAAWKLADIRAGLPRLAPAGVEAFTPQMLGLERLQAFSLKKGCYPGQEIVARTHYLGQARRGLQRLVAPQPLPSTGRLLQDTTEVGDLICAVSHGTTHEALAVLPVTATTGLRTEAGVEVRPLAFEDGLARECGSVHQNPGTGP